MTPKGTMRHQLGILVDEPDLADYAHRVGIQVPIRMDNQTKQRTTCYSEIGKLACQYR